LSPDRLGTTSDENALKTNRVLKSGETSERCFSTIFINQRPGNAQKDLPTLPSSLKPGTAGWTWWLRQKNSGPMIFPPFKRMLLLTMAKFD